MNIRKFFCNRIILISYIFNVFLFVFLNAAAAFAFETNYNNLKNRLGAAPPFPGVVVAEYERFVCPLSMNNSLSVGVDVGYAYDKVERFYKDDAGFESSMYVLNPFIRYYFGKSGWFVRPGIMLKPSVVMVDPGKDMKRIDVFPAYELHALVSVSYKRIFCTVGAGYKHFLRSGTIKHGKEETGFPSEKLMPAVDVIVGVTF